MKKMRLVNLVFSLALALTIIGVWAANQWIEDIPQKSPQVETIVLGQDQYAPGSQTGLRVIVRDRQNGAPLKGAEVAIALKPAGFGFPKTLFSGVTDSHGSLEAVFNFPDDIQGERVLRVDTRTTQGDVRIERKIEIKRQYRLLLSSDKPIYQPGQLIHLRTLALSAYDLRPAAEMPIEFVIADGKGNKVFRQMTHTSQYGVAALDFQLADLVNTGTYRISVELDGVSSEKTVQVEKYNLPKFDIQISTQSKFYQPGERVEGEINASYFFGKPVAEGQVTLQVYTFDVQENLLTEIRGRTDAQGYFPFEFELPSYLVGSDLEGGLGRIYLVASLQDQTDHQEIKELSLPVSRSAIIIEAIPEAGTLRPGVENILYILTSYPDGSPAECRLRVSDPERGTSEIIQTGPYGLAELRLTPQSGWLSLTIEAEDEFGNFTSRAFEFSGEAFGDSILLRPDKPVYKVGESMHLQILSQERSGSAYVDIVRSAQTVSTHSVDLIDGKAELTVDLSPEMFGTLELHAYKILPSGTIVRDTRLIVVEMANDLQIDISPSDSLVAGYRPGEEALLNLQVTGEDGRGVPSAIGLAIVDEAVFALAEQDPGFARLYFMLEEELLQPKYDIHGYSLPELAGGIPLPEEDIQNAVEGAARASLAAVLNQENISLSDLFSMQVNSIDEAARLARELQVRYAGILSKFLFGLFILLPGIMLLSIAYPLYKQKRLGKAILSLFGLLALLAWVGLFLIAGVLDGEFDFSLRELGWALESLFNQSSLRFVVLLYGSFVLAYLVLVWKAWRKKDQALRWQVALLPVYFWVVINLLIAAQQADLQPDEGLLLAIGTALFAVPLSFLLRGIQHTWKSEWLPALSSLVVGVTLMLNILPLASLWSASQVRQLMADLPPEAGVGPMMIEEAEVGAFLPLPTQSGVMEMAAVEKKADNEGESQPSETSVAPPRLRQYFPETMLWLPDLETDESGYAQVNFPVADSITTWRVTALASSQDGRLGSATAALRVFQEFFIDLNLPSALTVGDEISLPVGVFNYLPEAQNITLEIEQLEWFKLLEPETKSIRLEANEVGVVYFRLRALQFGTKPFKVTAWGSQMSDAIQKSVRVFPNGRQITFSAGDRLSTEKSFIHTLSLPEDAIPGTATLVVKIYPGVVSQVVEGLDAILRMPFGCFEQTSSTTYPNVLVLDYLKRSAQISPEVQMKAEEYINLGYQRLTTFEVAGGGFSLFGDAPADRMLTAYGLQEFADMSRVYNVDESLVRRAAEWLLSQQNADGSWDNDQGLVHENTWSSLGNDRLPVTAYIAWSLIEAGYEDNKGTLDGLDYIRDHTYDVDEAYTQALIVNALVAADLKIQGEIQPETQAALQRLADMAVVEGETAYWLSQVATFTGSEGKTGSIETTALAAYALLRAGSHPDLAQAALTYLIQSKDSFGTWYSTQATVLSLKALIQSLGGGAESSNAQVRISLNSGEVQELEINPENFDVVQMVTFDHLQTGGENQVRVEMAGSGNLIAQVSGAYYLPWEKLADYPELVSPQEAVSIQVTYDRTQLQIDDTVEVRVRVSLNQPGAYAENMLIDLGLPPGFSPLTEDLSALVAYYDSVSPDYQMPSIQKYELTGRQILIYVSDLSYEHPLEFTYRLRARFPLIASTPPSSAYDYYNPDTSGEQEPQLLVVTP